MERLRQQLDVAVKALGSFSESLQPKTPTLVERDAAIQRFEYTVEAMWKVAQRYLAVIEGLTAGSPKEAVRMSREAGVLTEAQAITALEMIDDRNLTIHTYNESIAQHIHQRLPHYRQLLDVWLAELRARSIR